MRIYGLDFTSAPDSIHSKAKKTKRLVLAVGKLVKQTLEVESLRILNTALKHDFSGFEHWLNDCDQPWIAGLDFPFSQPAALVAKLNWPRSWRDYISHIQQLGKQGFERQLIDFKASQPPGQKHLYRFVDRITRSQSPMTLAGTPVGKMFYEGAGRLRNADLHIPTLNIDGDRARTAIEVYPALVARKALCGNVAYKHDEVARASPEMEVSREKIVNFLRGAGPNGKKCSDIYNLTVRMSTELADCCITDFTGDSLDSVLCAVQAAWAYQLRFDNYGMPDFGMSDRDKIAEGWIFDPETMQHRI